MKERMSFVNLIAAGMNGFAFFRSKWFSNGLGILELSSLSELRQVKMAE